MNGGQQAGAEGGSAAGATAVFLLNMGGPDSLEAVRPFLENLFSDPEIFSFPLAGLVRQPLARWIAKSRSARVIPNYRAIGGKSPLLDITRAQASALDEALGSSPGRYSIHLAMRYWPPRAAAAVRVAKASRPARILVLPLYPQYCRATSGSSIADLERALELEGMGDVPRHVVRSWHDFPPYLDALADAVQEGLQRTPGAEILFSAHGVPVRMIERGDPYLDQVKATVAGVLERLPEVPSRLAFQSRTGPVRWLEPSVVEALQAMGREGVKRVVVVPVSFVSDHIETLHEIDIEYGELAAAAGIEEFHRSPSLNTRPAFIEALAALVRTAIPES